MNLDADSDQVQENLTATTKNSDLNNNVIFKEVPSPTQKNLTAKLNIAQVSENNVTPPRSLPIPLRLHQTFQKQKEMSLQ